MNKRKKLIIISGAVVVVILAVLLALRISANLKASQNKRTAVQNIKVTAPEKGDIYDKLLLSGDIIAIQQANIYSRVTGNIQNIFADVGDYVGKGKLLAVIDKSTFVQTVKQAEAQLKQYQATLELNKVNLDRTKVLFDKGLAPQGDYDNAVTQLKVSETQVESAEANYKNAMLQLSYCNITAPFSGFVTKRLLDVGTLVTSTSTTSNSIFIISDISSLKILINIPEKNIASIENIHEVNVKTDTYPDKTFTADFRKISQSLDLSTRTMQAEVRLRNDDKTLKPGMFAKIEILLDKHTDVLLIPVQCVMYDDKGDFLYTVTPENTAKKIYVTKGYSSDNNVEIITGINENDKIISVGQELVNDNSKVQISQ
ncbi:MAG: efflux RND transporter periplasmic adaptor subunit [Bacteroidetes bacterium]|nr:efflux RND transporter periplasmic adaptor subunit [Bacteroidota bacterium]